MEISYWLSRWNRNKTGFHATEVNQHLAECWSELGISPNSKVFVPLCGRSLDMIWLSNQGFYVLGVEASEKACRMFFKENSLSFDVIDQNNFQIFQAPSIEIWCGDYFKLRPGQFPAFEAVYDRAALVAMPLKYRQQYADTLMSLSGNNILMLLVTFSYPQEKMNGPPFSVTREEIQELYGRKISIQELKKTDVLERSQKFRDKGFTDFQEISYLVKTV